MAAGPAAAGALEAHLLALAGVLDLQASLVRGALGLHQDPSSSGQGSAEAVLSQFEVAVARVRSDLVAVTAAARGPERPLEECDVEDKLGNADSDSAAEVALDADPPEDLTARRTAVSYADQKESGLSQNATGKFLSARSLSSMGDSSRANTQYLMQVESVSRGQTQLSPCIDGALNPDWAPRLVWDMVIIALVLCDSVVIPFQLAEFRTQLGFNEVWLWLTFSFFLCDLVMNFFTGYRSGKKGEQLQEGTLVTNRCRIATNYIRGWFWIDFMSTVPWHVIADAFSSETTADTTSADQLTKLAKVIKLTRLLRLMRMLRLYKVSVIWERLESRIGSITALNVVSLIKVLGIWAAICHWGACCWWMVGKRNSLAMILTFQDDDPNELHWTEVPRMHSPHQDYEFWTWVEKPASEQYVFCFYWILGVMRTMPAEVTPVNLIERVFVLLFMFFAVMAFAVNVARLTQAWFKFSARKDAFKEEMAFVRMHLRTNKCTTSLQMRAQGYLQYLFEKRKVHAKETGLLSALPDGLKLQMRQAYRIPYLRLIPGLENWTEKVLRQFCDATETVDYLTGDKITERCNDAEAAYVLMIGSMQVFHETPSMTRLSTNDANNVTSVLRASWSSIESGPPLTVVDEHCLFEKEAKAVCKNTVVAMECSEVLRIDRLKFQAVMQMRGSSEYEDCLANRENVRQRAAGTPTYGNQRRSRASVAWHHIIARLGIPGGTSG
ncbi:unnamed protein product [Prorocentrum cordatum]|uniref:Cyclic nucleotide-binding domain-containing protein n=1 Tax=Prorocentrum cordatum TaxID=2364126 RepID=A0ABN9TNH6_9DINO|nr:unnamed protein product [Polarella glacialis]